MAEKHRFSATIEKASSGGAFVRIPFDVEAAFGKKRVPVLATIDGIAYRGSLVRMGTDCHVLGVLKEIRAEAGKNIGDTVEIVVEEDTAPREVTVPADLAAALAASKAAATTFEALAYSHKREYVRWIEEAKREETRTRRVAETVSRLESGSKPR